METWKRIDGFRGYYEVSDLGRVRSNNRLSKNKILKQRINNKYLKVWLQDVDKISCRSVARLVYETFNGKTELQIDHINEIKTDNRLINLQALSVRDNSVKSKRHNKTSKYPGVSLSSGPGKKWRSTIHLDGKKVHIGCFDLEEDAYKAYLNARTI